VGHHADWGWGRSNKKKMGGVPPPHPLTIPPHLASTLSRSTTVDCVKFYMVVNMKYAICRGSVLPDRLGLNQCLLIGKPPPPILDLLSDVIPPSIENFMHSEMERGGLN